jgi:hypothetical protein
MLHDLTYPWNIKTLKSQKEGNLVAARDSVEGLGEELGRSWSKGIKYQLGKRTKLKSSIV